MTRLIVSLSVLVVVIMGIRLISRGRISPILQYALWGLLPFRVLVFLGEQVLLPLPKSRFSAMYLAEELYRGTANSLREGMTDGAGFHIPMQIPGDAAAITGGGGGQAAMGAGTHGLQILFLIWMAGAVLLFLWLLAVNIRFYKRLLADRTALNLSAMSPEADERAEACGLPAVGRLRVYVCGGITTPCLAGPIRKAIYLPPWAVENRALLRYALIHELCHSKHGDLIWAAVRNAMLVLFWFHPLIWIGAAMSKRDCELACDAAVVRRIGDGERLAYGRALLEMISVRDREGHLMCAATAMSDSAKGIRERVARIASYKKTAAVALIAVILVTVLAVGCTFTEAADVGLKGMSQAQKAELQKFGQGWTEAYCARNGNALLQMCETREVLYPVGGYGGGEDGSGESGRLSIGVSSPWPWDSKDCKVFVTGPDTIDIYFLFQTSDPTGSVELHTLELTGKDGEQKVKKVVIPYAGIDSRKAFEEIYERYGFDYLSGLNFAGVWQDQADWKEGQLCKNSKGVKVLKGTILRDPAEAAIYELNLEGVSAALTGDSDPKTGDVYVDLTWTDGTVKVRMIQPGVSGKEGIWIPYNGAAAGGSHS